ncbi:hypothetical protein MLD38_010752 [Melastoma candidum]|uniref:Uncharacterized protein n=1 Tax=Melastoma candidum TaxID=119954 RepID=A0ACB9R0W9_9MYRT|nr:hypothetical protein MLD38_010752 [Melastoma candidum]
MATINARSLSLIFGILVYQQLNGNIGHLFYFCLCTRPAFYTMHKRKSSDGFQAIPYIVALSSAMLLLYYGLIKTDAAMIISINAIRCVIEVAYLVLFVFYTSKQEKIATLSLIALFNTGYLLVLFITIFLFKEQQRVDVVGWICAVFSIAVFASPLSIMTKVVRTKSMEFMPIGLSLFLILCATTWFLYGLLIRDMFIALPNAIGFLLGIAQIILYAMYKDANTENDGAKENQIDSVKLSLSRVTPEAMGMIILIGKPQGPKESNTGDVESGPARSE